MKMSLCSRSDIFVEAKAYNLPIKAISQPESNIFNIQINKSETDLHSSGQETLAIIE
jgi:hypothetical protein